MVKRLILILIIVAFSLSGCSSDGQSGNEQTLQEGAKPVETYRIGYSCMDIGNSFYQEFYEQLKKKCDDIGITLYLHDGKSDVAQQISILEKWVEEDLDAIICSPVDPSAIQNSADMCMDAGIPFINTDSECERKTAYIGVPQYDYGYMAGKIAAEWINKNLSSKAEVTCGILDTPQSFDFIDRTNGIIDGLTDNCASVNIVAHESYTTESDAFDTTWAILEKDINIDCIIASTEAGISGAYKAFLASGINTKERCLVGLGASTEVLEKIAEGTIVRGTVAQDIEEFAKGALSLAMNAIKDKLDVERIEMSVMPMTIDNVKTKGYKQ